MADYQHWIVGSTVASQDMTEHFFSQNLWFADREDRQALIEEVKTGDRLALKKMVGPTGYIWVLGLGVVRETTFIKAVSFRFLQVSWLDLRNEERKAPFGNNSGSIRKMSNTEPYFNDLFRL